MLCFYLKIGSPKSEQEIVAFNKTIDNRLWSGLKSGMNPEETLHGRPYAEVGFLVKKSTELSNKLLNTNSNRVLGLQISIGKNVLLIL